MSDERADETRRVSSVEGEPEDRLTEHLLDALASEGPLPDPASGGERELIRDHLEALCALPYELEPIVPAPGALARLLARVASEPAPVARAGTRAADRSGEETAAATGASQPSSWVQRWLLPLAAVVVLALVGLDLALVRELAEQRRAVSELSARLDAAQQRSAAVDGLRTELAKLRGHLELLTGSSVAVCSLRPVGEHMAHTEARGVLFVAEDHQHWYLALEDLPIAPGGRVYQLWFLAGGEPFSGGVFAGRPGERLELYSDTMPDGTDAVAVTLEPPGGASAPTGPRILFGNELLTIL